MNETRILFFAAGSLIFILNALISGIWIGLLCLGFYCLGYWIGYKW